MNYYQPIDVDFSNSSNSVSATTVLEKKNNGWGRNSIRMEINYVVNMPVSNSLSLKHAHGSAQIADINGLVDIDLKHGSFKAGKLGNQLNIDLAHGNGEFESTGDVEIDLRHGKLIAESVGEVDLDAGHATFETDEAKDIDFSASHSNLIAGKIGKLSALSSNHNRIKLQSATSIKFQGNHSNIAAENVAESLVLNMNHGHCKSGLSNQFKEVDLNGTHAGFTLNIASGAQFSMEASSTHGGIKYPSGMEINYNVQKNHSKTVKGYYGSNSSNRMVKAKLSHGNLNVSTL